MMENQWPAKRRREEEAGSIMDEEDRISQLPEQILHHHILFLFPQKQAVGTCILSKSWRHLGPTRPKLEFHQSDFPEGEEKFLSVVENTLQRYDDQKLSVQDFVLSMILHRCPSNDSNSLLNKWNVKLHMLKRLSLQHVYIEDENFEKIMSTSCPSIQHLVLHSCQGLSSVKVNKARNLKHLDCEFVEENGVIEINDDAPSLETIRIKGGCGTWHLNKNNYFLPRLKSLYLFHVHLPAELLDNLSSNNCPSLEHLELRYCSGFAEFELSNRSIKRLIIIVPDPNCPINAAIDAPNMLYFEFRSGFLPTISFATTSREWKSVIKVWRSSHSDADVSSTWYPKLHEFLKALSQSQISLDISYLPELTNHQDSIFEPRVVVEHLCLRGDYSSYSLPQLLNCVFGICRPRYIQLPYFSNSQILCESQHGEYIWKTLVEATNSRRQFSGNPSFMECCEINFLIF